MTETTQPFLAKLLKLLGKVLLGIIGFLLFIILLVRVPIVQSYLVKKSTTYLSEKIGSRVSIDKFLLTYSIKLSIEGLLIEDQRGDTLIYSQKLLTGVKWWPLLQGKIHLKPTEWNGFKANIVRLENDQFNFQFVLDAFQSEKVDETTVESTDGELQLDILAADILLTNFDLTYRDSLDGVSLQAKFKQLNISPGHLAPGDLSFEIKSITLEDAQIDMLISAHADRADIEDTSSPLLFLNIGGIKLKNVGLTYQSIPDQSDLTAFIGDFYLEAPEINLKDQIIKINTLQLSNSDISWIQSPTVESPLQSAEKIENPPLSLPDWDIQVDHLTLENNKIVSSSNGKKIVPGQFQNDHMDLELLAIKADFLQLQKHSIKANLRQFQLKDHSGFSIKDLRGDLSIDESNLTLKQFAIETDNSFLLAELTISYTSIEQLLNNPEELSFNLDLKESLISVKDAYHFDASLRNTKEVKAFAKNPLSLTMNLKGSLDQLEIDRLSAGWGSHTQLYATGSIQNARSPKDLSFELQNVNLKSRKQDFTPFLPDSLGIEMPDNFRLEGYAKGNMNAVDAKIKSYTSFGNIGMEGQFHLVEEIPHFTFDYQVVNLLLHELLNQPDIGALSLTGTLAGSGNSIDNLDAIFSAQITDFCVQDIFFYDSRIEGEFSNKQLFASLQSKEDFLESKIDFMADLTDSIGAYAVQIHLDRLDAEAIGATNFPLELAIDASLNINGTVDDFDAFIRLHYGKAKTSNKTYDIKQLTAEIEIDTNHTYLVAQTNWIQLKLNANANPNVIYESLDRFFRQNLDSTYVDSLHHEFVNLDLNFNILPDSFLTEILLPDLETFETTGLAVSFREKEGKLDVAWPWQKINYRGYEVKDLTIDLHANQEGISYDMRFQGLQSDLLSLEETGLHGIVKRLSNQITLNLFSRDQLKDTLLYIAHEFHYQEDLYEIHINPKQLILNRDQWHIPKDNLLQITPDFIKATAFQWSNEDQKFAIENLPGRADDHIQLSFDNFQISSLTSLLDEEAPPFDGNIQGSILIENVRSDAFFLANITVSNLVALGEQLGNLSMEAARSHQDTYQVNLNLKGGPVDLDASGQYKPLDEINALSFRLNLNELDLKLAERLSNQEISDASGSIRGRAELTGTFSNPKYEAELFFDNARLLVSKVNESFIMQDEKIVINNKGIFFDRFKIRNSENQLSTINGNIDLENLSDPGLNLNIQADNFRLINSTKADNDLFYGRALIDFNFKVSGRVSLPIVNATTRLKSGTDLTFIVPESELELIEKEGIVLFVNMQSEEDLEDQIARVAMSDLTGIELNAQIQVDSNSILRVILDDRSGDNLTISGTADLNLGIETNGRISLSGSYIVSRGHYELNLYDLVRRRFEMVPGSQITWTGDPYNAILNLSALYRVRTASSDLMSAQLINADVSQRNMYRQELPFEVYLRIGGELLQPQISFRMDMPETHRDAMSGNIYSRINQLNENESELNKQVFSLMVLNRFLPEDLTGGSSGGGTSAIARSSVSQVLSNQLNTLSDRFVQGVDLNFDLDSYTDYQSGTGADVTQLNVRAQKSLLDDRLIISVNSQFDLENESRRGQQQASEIIGDINLEYLITSDGRYRIRGFRRNEFEGAVEGLLIVAGVSLVYKREFDRLSELWKKPKSDKSPAENIEEELKQILSEPIE